MVELSAAAGGGSARPRWRRRVLAGAAALALAGCASPAAPPAKQAWDRPAAREAQPPGPRPGAPLPLEVDGRLAILNANCARGGDGACIEIGRLFERGEGGVPRSPDRAAEAYGLACRRLDAEGCQRLEALLGAEDTMPTALASVQASFAAACGRQLGDACVGLATLYAHGLGAPESPARAAEILAKACEAGSGTACHRLGRMVRLGVGAKADADEASRLEQKACTLGRQAACVGVGVRVLEMTDGRRQRWSYGFSSTDQALDAFRTACSKGEYSGCVEYARALVEGKGITRDRQAGQALLRSSCEDGYGRACLLLGDLLAEGGAERGRPGGALAWWRKGCEVRDGDACARAGEALLGTAAPAGRGPPRPEPEAARALLDRACVLHSPSGCRLLGQAIHRGQLAEPGRAAPIDYEGLACRYGAEEGCPRPSAGRALRGP